jgi:hypothetical protein
MLMDKFHYTFDEVVRMTDRQKHEILLHKRDEHGGIVMPELPPEDEEPMTLEQQLIALDQMAVALRMHPQAIQEAKQKLKAKYAAKDGA